MFRLEGKKSEIEASVLIGQLSLAFAPLVIFTACCTLFVVIVISFVVVKTSKLVPYVFGVLLLSGWTGHMSNALLGAHS